MKLKLCGWVVAFLIALALLSADTLSQKATPSLEESLAWLKKLDVNYERPRFQTLTPESLKRLTDVVLGGHTKSGHVHVPAEDFKYLLPLTSLKKANLGEIDGLTDEALVHIGQLTSLTHLYLHQGHYTDAGLKHLTALKNLTRLVLGGTQAITDAGITEVVKIKTLEDLRISYTSVSDAGMKMLQELPRLTKLRIINTDVTDVGIAHLAHIKGLTELHINMRNEKDITPGALADLQKALPNLQIDPTTMLDPDDDDIEITGDWFYDDLDAAYAFASKTGRPLMVVFR